MYAVSKTDIGLKRQENQDRVMTCVLDETAAFAVLCDGMGGENAGGLASELAVHAVYERITSGYRPEFDKNNIRNLLISAVAAANVIVYEHSKESDGNIGMGTTCVAALWKDNTLFIINVGDSRAYLLSSDGIRQLTVDHTVVRMLYETGKITEDEMKEHPKKNYITKAIGVLSAVEPDYFEIPVDNNPILLLCSDGLNNTVSDEMIFELAEGRSMADYTELLIKTANENGGSDNISVAVILDKAV